MIETKAGIDPSVDEVEKWHVEEEGVLTEKADDCKIKSATADEKLDLWQQLNHKAKRRKCIAKLRSLFRKPLKIHFKLIEQGDDILLASTENLRPYRMQRLIDAYENLLMKLNDQVAECHQATEDYPDSAESAGGFDWDIEMPPLKDEDGNTCVMTSDGILKSAK